MTKTNQVPVKENDKVEMTGIVKSVNKDFFTVDVEMGDHTHKIICKPAGKLRKHSIFILIGDAVRVECSPYDLAKGRIVHRFMPSRNQD